MSPRNQGQPSPPRALRVTCRCGKCGNGLGYAAPLNWRSIGPAGAGQGSYDSRDAMWWHDQGLTLVSGNGKYQRWRTQELGDTDWRISVRCGKCRAHWRAELSEFGRAWTQALNTRKDITLPLRPS